MPTYHLRPFKIISLSFWRIASMSGSAKEVSKVLTLFVFALVRLVPSLLRGQRAAYTVRHPDW